MRSRKPIDFFQVTSCPNSFKKGLKSKIASIFSNENLVRENRGARLTTLQSALKKWPRISKEREGKDTEQSCF